MRRASELPYLYSFFFFPFNVILVPCVEGNKWSEGVPSMVLACSMQVYRLFEILATLYVCILYCLFPCLNGRVFSVQFE